MQKQIFAAKGKLKLIDILHKIIEQIEAEPDDPMKPDEQVDHGY